MYLQQQVQLHACITSPDTWAPPKWSRLDRFHRDMQSADRQLRVSAGPSSLDIVTTVGQVLVSCPLLPHETEALRGTSSWPFDLLWAPDGSRLSLARLVHHQQTMQVQVLELSAEQLARLPPVVLQMPTLHRVHAHGSAWSPCSTQLAVFTRSWRSFPHGGGKPPWRCQGQSLVL